VNDFLDKAEAFPEGKYNDQVDALSGAVGKPAQAPELAFIFG
jgi:phage terminase large subunit-like protein